MKNYKILYGFNINKSKTITEFTNGDVKLTVSTKHKTCIIEYTTDSHTATIDNARYLAELYHKQFDFEQTLLRQQKEEQKQAYLKEQNKKYREHKEVAK